MILNIYIEFHEDILNGFYIIVRFLYYSAYTILSQKLLFYKVQRGTTYKQELLLLCSSWRLTVLNICTCMKFHKKFISKSYSSSVLQVILFV